MSNPDGVILGNYRTSMSGNDLNRRYQNPDYRLHPTVTAIKEVMNKAHDSNEDQDPILAFLDFHGHSKKKNVFMYGPYYPLHSEKYSDVRVLAKLLSNRTDMFRYYSCKFRNERSKQKTARLVLSKEFDLMNSFTVEASFHGYLTQDRTTVEFASDELEKMGSVVGLSLLDYAFMIEQDERQRIQRLKEAKKRKQKKRNAKNFSTKDVAKQLKQKTMKTPNKKITDLNVSTEIKLKPSTKSVDNPGKRKGTNLPNSEKKKAI